MAGVLAVGRLPDTRPDGDDPQGEELTSHLSSRKPGIRFLAQRVELADDFGPGGRLACPPVCASVRWFEGAAKVPIVVPEPGLEPG